MYAGSINIGINKILSALGFNIYTSAVCGLKEAGAMFTEVPRVCAVVDGVTRVTNVREDARTGRTRRAMIAAMCKTYSIDN